MTKEFAHRFNEEIERYRNIFLQFARKCEWDAFEMKAGKFFDYVEFIELGEIKNKFSRTFGIILMALLVLVVAIFSIDVTSDPELTGLKEAIILLAVAVSCFELFFFLNFRTYVAGKLSSFKKRRDSFVKGIEMDFKQDIVQCEG
jgi:hypothetical protein